LKISKYVFGDFLLNHHPDEVVLSAHWSDECLPELENTVSWLQQHGMKVIVFGPPFEYDMGLPGLLFSSIRDNNPGELTRHWVAENRELDQRIGHLAREKWRIGYISEFEDLCSSSSASVAGVSADRVQGCPVYAAPGVPLIFDKFHLTAAGSVLYAQSIRAHQQLP
jgi:hypothetical protein